MDRFGFDKYVIRRKVLRIFGGAFYVHSSSGELAFYATLEAFKLKEDIRLFTGEDKQSEVLSIKARRMMDFSGTYDVNDSRTGERIGALQRQGLRSMIQDEWTLFDAQEQKIGILREDNTTMALLRRFLTNLIPQSFDVIVRGVPVASFDQNFNPFIKRMTVDFTLDPSKGLDRRLGIAAAILLCAIEGRQD